MFCYFCHKFKKTNQFCIGSRVYKFQSLNYANCKEHEDVVSEQAVRDTTATVFFCCCCLDCMCLCMTVKKNIVKKSICLPPKNKYMYPPKFYPTGQTVTQQSNPSSNPVNMYSTRKLNKVCIIVNSSQNTYSQSRPFSPFIPKI